MDPSAEYPPDKRELLHQIMDRLERLDRPYLQKLVDHLDRDALAQVWVRINRYDAELQLVDEE